MSKLGFYKTVLFTELAQALGQPDMTAEKSSAVEEFIARTAEVILEKESDYSALLTRHNALVEAVAWERECEEMHEDKCVMYLNTRWEYEVWCSLKAARAEVGRLLWGCCA